MSNIVRSQTIKAFREGRGTLVLYSKISAEQASTAFLAALAMAAGALFQVRTATSSESLPNDGECLMVIPAPSTGLIQHTRRSTGQADMGASCNWRVYMRQEPCP